MNKSTKEAPKSPKKTRNIKAQAAGLYSLAVALAELATVYLLVTQGRQILLPLAVVLGVDCSQRFAVKFIR